MKMIKDTTLHNGFMIILYKKGNSYIIDGTLLKKGKEYKTEKVALKCYDQKLKEWNMISVV